MAGKRKLEVVIAGDAKGLASAVKSGNSSLGSFGKVVGKVALGVGAAAAGAVAGLTAIGGSFDEASDAIRVGTGATGEALAGLESDFKSVVSEVPTDFGRAATAIADLNTRTGQTGEGLQDLAKRSLELSRITKTDIGTVVASTTRIFGDWSIATGDQAETLDKLYRASQSTGIGVDKLAETVVSFGAPLRQMGFSFEESIAMLGKWEKEGVNTEAILGGLKQALGKMAKAGKEPVAEFKRLSEEIANAGSAGEANSIAVEAFGSRAGPDLAAAVREGRFELTDYIAAIEDGSDTIMGAAADTRSWRESLQEFKNKALVLIEPLATKVFDGISRGFDIIGPKMIALATDWGPKISMAFDQIGEFVQTRVVPALLAISAWWDVNGPTIITFAKDFAAGVVEAFRMAADAAQWIVANWSEIQPIALAIAGVIAAVFIPHLVALGVASVTSSIKQAAAWVVAQASAIKAAAIHSAQVVGMVAKWVLLGAQSLLHAAKVAASWVVAMGPVGWVIATVVGLVALVIANWEKISEFTSRLWATITGWISEQTGRIVAAVSTAVTNVVTFFRELPGKALAAIQSFATTVASFVIEHHPVAVLLRKAIEFWPNVQSWFTELPGRIVAALGNLGSLLVDAGRSILDGLWRGLREKWESVKDWVGGLGSKIKGLKGPIQADRVLLRDEGRAILEGLSRGLRDKFPQLRATLRDAQDLITVRGDARGSLTGGIPATGVAGAGGPAVQIENAYFNDGVDVDLFNRRVAFAAQGGTFGG